MSAPHALDRLHQSRDELRNILGPVVDRNDDQFPRSMTMRLLVSKTGTGMLGALLGAALLRVSPRAGKLLSMVPVSAAVARSLFARRRGS